MIFTNVHLNIKIISLFLHCLHYKHWLRFGCFNCLLYQILIMLRYHTLNFHCFYIKFVELEMERKNKVTSTDDEHQPIVNSTIK